jgi:hypothetical protein
MATGLNLTISQHAKALVGMAKKNPAKADFIMQPRVM